MAEEHEYRVAGMSCEHCRAAVVDAVGRLEGVSEVRVDLDAGRVRVRAAAIDDALVRAAIGEAGYEVAP